MSIVLNRMICVDIQPIINALSNKLPNHNCPHESSQIITLLQWSLFLYQTAAYRLRSTDLKSLKIPS